ncbi:NAD(P)H-dependent oxidoreductase [Bacillus spizizenii]|uniref:NAD(P)H-dependent oxidoreductase n=2 Tax=Bacillus spizizenii TaxID=96241 RepID=A0A9Q4DQ24_BACSC|nr:NAD(P)H-dependent oxidoreductase [Bacillus spizizenii]KFI02723.1 general stress protein [Bacillus sp. BSC154]QCJ18642.1 NAD(P)H-dependent oxidoreductase [Bacillus subtilis]ADM39573.1 nitroreductase [Bacillus spizizenii str. W23]AJW85045.1 general stress protein [Bacillus spizizenii]EFG93322.1 nitroreductase [Bacillus spizizenii ATCC 6633 = JCM 2499]
MKILVLAVHPHMETSVVNKAWTEELSQHDNITVRELYKEYPNEAIDVAKEQQLCEQYDRIVFQFPFYWYSSPPLLKKWQDLVLTYGWAFGSEGNALHGKELMLAVSTGSEAEKYQAGGANHYSISELLKPFQATSNLIGMKYLPPYVFYGVNDATAEDISLSAKRLAEYIQKPFA